MTNNEKYYESLGLDTNASLNEVTQAYKDMIKVWNPDRFVHDIRLKEKAEIKSREIDTAFDYIMKSHGQDARNTDLVINLPDNEKNTNQIHDVLPIADREASISKKRYSTRLFALFIILGLLILGGIFTPVLVAMVFLCLTSVENLLLIGLALCAFVYAGKYRSNHNIYSSQTAIFIGRVLTLLLIVNTWQHMRERKSQNEAVPTYGGGINSTNAVNMQKVFAQQETAKVEKSYIDIINYGQKIVEPKKANSNKNHAPNISSDSQIEDVTRLKEIMQHVVFEQKYLTSAIRAEFWQIVDKSGSEGEAEIKAAREKLMFKTDVYDRQFYNDALISYQTRRPFKSEQLKQNEKQILNLGISSSGDIDSSDELMQHIANHEPAVIQGQTIIIDDIMIHKILNNLDNMKLRLETLLSRP